MKRDIQGRRESEKAVVGQMIGLYCKKQHGAKTLCPECEELLEYAVSRIDKCPFMETKKFCSNCKVHCYRKDMQQRIRIVMRFSGPRMLFVHPIMATRHVLLSWQEKRRIDA